MKTVKNNAEMTLMHAPTGNIGVFVKSHFPTGKSETIIIRLKDGQLFFAPAIEFIKVKQIMEGEKANRGWGESRQLKPRRQVKFYAYEENYPIIDSITGNRNAWLNEAVKCYNSYLNKKSLE